MSDVRIVINDHGIQELLKSAAIKADLEERAKKIAEAAGPGNVAGVDEGRTRARGYVVTATPQAQEAEATNRSLTRAIEAGR